MNQKKAKALRRMARKIAEDLPERGILTTSHSKVQHYGLKTVATTTTTAFNNPQTVRGIERQLKGRRLPTTNPEEHNG